MWGHPSSKTSLKTPTKDFRVVKPENWVGKLNSRSELGLYVGLLHPKTGSKLTKLEKLIFEKLGLHMRLPFFIDKTMFGQSPPPPFPLVILLLKLKTAPSPETKNCRVVKLENWVSEFNILTELGLYVGSSHPNTMSEMTKFFFIKATNKTSFELRRNHLSQKRAHMMFCYWGHQI